MRRRGRGPAGQSTLELCLGLAVILLALMGMFFVLRGAIGGRWKSVGDTFGHGMQYAPGTAP
jgi:hypothetical protein